VDHLTLFLSTDFLPNTDLFYDSFALCCRASFESVILRVLLVAGSRSAEDFAEDVANAGAAIAPAVVAVVVITTILSKSCRIALHEAISKLLRPSVPIVV